MKKILFLSLALVFAFMPANLDARKHKYPNGDQYDGEWKNKAPNGMGVMIYANGEIYSGYWTNGIKNGLGTMRFLSGDEYLGNWENDKISGEGKMTYANKDYYEGNWLDNKQHGEGSMTYADGSTYIGGWAAGLYDGKGVREYPNKDRYEGGWAAGKQQGEGAMQYATGASYSGSWEAGAPSGEGKMCYENGDVYTGKWLSGKRSGEGEFYDKAHDRFLVGTWNGSALSGKGSIGFGNDPVGGLTLQGEWMEDGMFQTTYSFGDRTFFGTVLPLSGDSVTGPMLSSGKVVWQDGTIADGIWKPEATLAGCVYTDMISGRVHYSIEGRTFDGDVKDGKENNGTLTVSIPGIFSFSGELKAGEPFGIYVGDFKASPFQEFDLSAWDEVQGADIGRIDGKSALSGVYRDSTFTVRGLLKDGVPDGEVYMEYTAPDSLSMNSFWKDGKVVEGKGVLDAVPFTLSATEDGRIQIDLENGERCTLLFSTPFALLPDIRVKVCEQRTLREKMAAEMKAMAAAQEAAKAEQPASAE